MKKMYLLLLLPLLSMAQENAQKIATGEFKSNLFDLVVAKSFNVGFEKFLNHNQALQFDVTIFDTYSYVNANYLDENNVVGLQASYNIYFSKNKKHHGFVFYPFIKYRTGTQVVENYSYYYDASLNSVIEVPRTFDLSGFEAGFGLGHKWLFNDKVSLGVGVQLGRNFSTSADFKDSYSPIDFKANVTLGFRL